jgi:hypothetical protein
MAAGPCLPLPVRLGAFDTHTFDYHSTLGRCLKPGVPQASNGRVTRPISILTGFGMPWGDHEGHHSASTGPIHVVRCRNQFAVAARAAAALASEVVYEISIQPREWRQVMMLKRTEAT